MAPEQATQTEEGTRSYYAPTPVQPAHTASQPYAAYPGAYGQPFQPYQPPQQPGEVANRPWEITKITLHGASVVFGICAVGTSLAMLQSTWSGIIFALCTAPIAAVCIIWSGVELIVRAVRKWKTGIHPGAHVGVSLIIWLAAAFTGGIESSYLALVDESDSYSSRSRCWDSEIQEFGDCPRDRYYEGRKPIATAACVFTVLLWLVHFILFIGACVDTGKRNAARRTVVYMPPATYYAPPGPNAWPQQPQHPAAAAGIPLQNRNSDAPAETTEPKIPAVQPPPMAATTPQAAHNAGVTEFYSPQGGR